MDRVCSVCQQLFVCLALALLALGVLVVPDGFLWAESGGPDGGDGPLSNVCPNNSCPNPISNGCSAGNGNEGSCANLCCATQTQGCDCEFSGSTCSCPGAVAPPPP
jgi:hypothetical protein